jgi:hypothetical protein
LAGRSAPSRFGWEPAFRRSCRCQPAPRS